MNAGDHDHPALFEPTEEEIEEQERRDAEEYRAHEDRLDAEAEAERLQMEERDNEISAQIYATPYNPPRLTEAQRRGTMTEDEYEAYIADCDSYENIQEP